MGLSPALAAALMAQPTTSGCDASPALSYKIPTGVAGSNSQANVNCMAWQDFIAVNWQASLAACTPDTSIPASKFGEPNNTRPAAWGNYEEASDLFQKDGAAPAPWCSGEALKRGTKYLGSRFTQAGASGAWLTAQNHHVALYEIRVNQDVFSYVHGNRLYNAAIQEIFPENAGIDLPDGTTNFAQYGKTDSMIFKASWIELPDPSRWPYFKISKAYVVNPDSSGLPRLVTVGLVGLHIIHKTAKSPQFIWATFEHVNNAPSTADIKNNTLRAWYMFYNPRCNPQADHYHCYPNGQPVGENPAHPVFPHHPDDPYDAPEQVVRDNPISSTTFNNVAGLNQWVWNLLRASNPNSVFLNYQLVDVLWANSPAVVPKASPAPLSAGNPLPNPAIHKVANTTIETYFQNTFTCLDCHTQAAIAFSVTSKKMGSDYSFLFGKADSSAR